MSAPTPARDGRIPPPSARQREVWALVAAGLGNKEIARALGIAQGTVKIHLVDVFKRTGCRNRVEAALRFHGLPVGGDPCS